MAFASFLFASKCISLFQEYDKVEERPEMERKLISFLTLVGIDASLRREDGTIMSMSTSASFLGVNFP